MKKILLAIAAVATITSCSQNEEFESLGQKTEIKIGTIVSKSTRAAEADGATLETNGFTLYAFNTGAKEMSNVEANGLTDAFINGKSVLHSTGSWVIPDGPYYWPLNENLQFFGYSPAAKVSSWATTTQYPSFSYTIQDEQEDLLAVSVYDQKKSPSVDKGALTLKFKHILTQINFKLKGKDAGCKYNVTKVELNGVANTGTYTYNASTGEWRSLSGSKDYIYGATAYSEIDGTGESTITGTDLGLMLMPNNDLSSIKIVVTYSTTINNKTVFTGSKEVVPTGTWGIGQRILYTLTLPSGAEAITVDPSVDGWNDEAGNQGEWTDPVVTP